MSWRGGGGGSAGGVNYPGEVTPIGCPPDPAVWLTSDDFGYVWTVSQVRLSRTLVNVVSSGSVWRVRGM